MNDSMSAKENLLSKIDNVNAALSTSPIVKGLIDGGLSLIPFLGQAITSALDTRAFQLFEGNSRQFAEEVRRLLSRLDETKLDKQFMESDEFVSLLIEILARNARTYEQEKISLYARVFVNAATYDKSEVSYKEGFIRIIDELSVEHIRVLAFIKDGVLAKDVSEALRISLSRTQAYCDQMIRFGLLRDQAIGKYGYEPGFYAITDYGRELAEFLKSQE